MLDGGNSAHLRSSHTNPYQFTPNDAIDVKIGFQDVVFWMSVLRRMSADVRRRGLCWISIPLICEIPAGLPASSLSLIVSIDDLATTATGFDVYYCWLRAWASVTVIVVAPIQVCQAVPMGLHYTPSYCLIATARLRCFIFCQRATRCFRYRI